MLKPGYNLYWLLFLTLVFSASVAADTEQSCDIHDIHCSQGTITATATTSYVTPSSSSYYESYSSLNATSTEFLSDFHEAKVVKPKPHNPNLPTRPDILNPQPDPSIEDTVNNNVDVGSSTAEGTDTHKSGSSLSNIEAGVLSACGILVVAGVAVGIFVWKNTTRRRNLRRNHDMPMTDIENNLPDEDGHHVSIKMEGVLNNDMILDDFKRKPSGKNALLSLPVPSLGRDDFFTSWQKRQENPDHFEFEPKQKLPNQQIIPDQQTTTAVLDLTLDDKVPDENEQEIKPGADIAIEIVKEEEVLITENGMEIGLDPPGLQANTTIPSAVDPHFDPTALTYPLHKFLHTPVFSGSPAMQISVTISDDDDDEEEDEDQNYHEEEQQIIENQITYQPDPQVITKRVTPSTNLRGKEQQAVPLSPHLNKLLRTPQLKQRMKSNGSGSSRLVEINLQDDPPLQQQHADSIQLHPILGKFAKEPLPSLDENSKQTLEHLEQAYRDVERDRDHGPAQLFIDDYKKKYLQEHGKPFMSPLDLPNDQYIPLRDATGPALISRAEILADPVRRLGEDEIALWEQSVRRRGSASTKKRFSYKTWDDQTLRDDIEQNDRRDIAQFYGDT